MVFRLPVATDLNHEPSFTMIRAPTSELKLHGFDSRTEQNVCKSST